MKKKAFSYLELIISMGLVVMVVFLTTPFLVHMSKATTAKFGEYRAYAKYDETSSEWVLYQNVRYGFKEYMKEDEPCPKGPIDKHHPEKLVQICSFVLPNHVMSYKVHLYGGGGAGSNPFFDENVSYDDDLAVSKGAGGEGGQFLSKQDNLSRAVLTDDNSTIQIYNCNDILDEDERIFPQYNTPVNCVGVGGKSSEIEQNAYNANVQRNLHKRFIRDLFDKSSLSLSKYYYQDKLYDKLTEYVKAQTEGKTAIAEKIRKILLGENVAEYPDFRQNWNPLYIDVVINLPYNVKVAAESGEDSYFQFDDTVIGKPAFAAGGKGAITFADNQASYNMTSAGLIIPDSINSFYRYGDNYVISGEAGKNSNINMGGTGGDCLNNSSSYDEAFCAGLSPFVGKCSRNDKPSECSDESNLKLYYFGAGGGGGAFRYVPSTGDSPAANHPYNGGRGAGGAVVIEWN